MVLILSTSPLPAALPSKCCISADFRVRRRGEALWAPWRMWWRQKLLSEGEREKEIARPFAPRSASAGSPAWRKGLRYGPRAGGDGRDVEALPAELDASRRISVGSRTGKMMARG